MKIGRREFLKGIAGLGAAAVMPATSQTVPAQVAPVQPVAQPAAKPKRLHGTHARIELVPDGAPNGPMVRDEYGPCCSEALIKFDGFSHWHWLGFCQAEMSSETVLPDGWWEDSFHAAEWVATPRTVTRHTARMIWQHDPNRGRAMRLFAEADAVHANLTLCLRNKHWEYTLTGRLQKINLQPGWTGDEFAAIVVGDKLTLRDMGVWQPEAQHG